MFRPLFAACILLVPNAAFSQGKVDVKPSKTWTGSVPDENLAKIAPAAIGNAAAFEKLWQDWGLKTPLPKIDFETEFAVIQTTSGSRISLMLKKSDGDLQVNAIATRDFGPGFRYVIGSVPREGIKTVNGQPLEKK